MHLRALCKHMHSGSSLSIQFMCQTKVFKLTLFFVVVAILIGLLQCTILVIVSGSQETALDAVFIPLASEELFGCREIL